MASSTDWVRFSSSSLPFYRRRVLPADCWGQHRDIQGQCRSSETIESETSLDESPKFIVPRYPTSQQAHATQEMRWGVQPGGTCWTAGSAHLGYGHARKASHSSNLSPHSRATKILTHGHTEKLNSNGADSMRWANSLRLPSVRSLTTERLLETWRV